MFLGSGESQIWGVRSQESRDRRQNCCDPEVEGVLLVNHSEVKDLVLKGQALPGARLACCNLLVLSVALGD